MQTLRMKTEFLPGFLEALEAWGTLYAPVERAPDVFALEPIDDVAKPSRWWRRRYAARPGRYTA